MTALGLLVIVQCGLTANSNDSRPPSAGRQATDRTVQLPPDGLSSSDWSSIRAAYDAGRHAVFAERDGYVARNPGQQWRTRFDGRGFTATPDAGGWTWGLELIGYGRGVSPVSQRGEGSAPRVTATGQRVEYAWDDNLTEWYVNDARGLEHGYTVHRRPGSSAVRAGEQGACSDRRLKPPATIARPPGGKEAGGSHEPLQLTLAVRGDLRPRLCNDGRGVTFVDSNGAAAVNYAGLKVFDADGVSVPARFETVAEGLRLSVDERAARYPLTIDPIAQQAYLKASNTEADDQFGWSVSASGDTLVVGATGEDSNATGVNGNQADNSAGNSGAAYVFVRSGTTWTQQAYLKASNTGAGDGFGSSVAVSGDTVVVGATDEDSNATGVNGNQADDSAASSGAAYVFVRSGGVWTQQAYLKASNAEMGDNFGSSVSVAGETAVVGAIGEDSNALGVNGNQANNSALESGAVYVFVRNSGLWSQQAYLKSSNSAAVDSFGNAVGISDDTIVVGAVGEDSNATGVNGNQSNNSAFESGAAFVFARSGTTWSQQAYLKASNTGAVDQFGYAVAISNNTVVVGANLERSNATGVNGNQADNSAGSSGAAYVFVRVGMTWSQQAYLKASNTGGSDQFGYSVAVSGDTVVVGAWSEDSSATGVNSNQADNSAGNSGAAYVFVRSGTTWSQQAYVKASNTGEFDNFGSSVSASGGTVVIGAWSEDSSATGVNGGQADDSTNNAGAAYVFLIPDCDGDGVWDEADNCPLTANAGQEDADGDGAGDVCDVCPGTAAGLPVAPDGRPLRDCNTDCVVDGDDAQCMANEMLGP